MGGGCVFIGTSVALIFSVASSFAENPELSKLETKRANHIAALEKIQKGADPCFTNSCQAKKFQLINKIYQVSSSIPSLDVFLSRRAKGIQSAYDLIRKKFQPSTSSFPRTASEWASYWKKRSNQESELRSTWLSFYAELHHIKDAFAIYTKAAKSSEENRILIQEAWEKGLGEISRLMIQSTFLQYQSNLFERQGRSGEARSLLTQALSLTEKRMELEQNFRGQFRPIVEELFPDQHFDQTIKFVDITQKWIDRYGATHVFDPDFIDRASSHAKDTLDLVIWAQEFTDLEYGYIGLSNFYSSTNPEVRAESEIVVQEFLDQVEDRVRAIVDMGAYYLMAKAGRLMFDSRILQNIALPTAYNLLSEEKGWGFSKVLWEPTSRTQELKASLPTLKSQIETRYSGLLNTRDAVRQKIQELDLQISLLKEMEEPHETNTQP